jgi:hypothetical protein
VVLRGEAIDLELEHMCCRLESDFRGIIVIVQLLGATGALGNDFFVSRIVGRCEELAYRIVEEKRTNLVAELGNRHVGFALEGEPSAERGKEAVTICWGREDTEI